MALTPAQLAELQRMRDSLKPGNDEFNRRMKALANLEKVAGAVKLPTDKKDKGGSVEVRPTVFDDAASRRNPSIEAAARALMEGELKQKAYAKLVAKEKPVKKYDFIPQPATNEKAMDILLPRQKQNWRSHESWPAGRRVGLRLDIPAYERHGVWVNSIHDESSGKDKFPTSYGPVSSVRNATFEGSPDKAIRVATGEQTKTPFARIKGELEHINEEQAVEHFKKYLNHPDYRQVGYDPRRHGDFYDRETMQPITHSEHVVQIGPLVLAKNPKYGKPSLYAKGGDVHKAKGGDLTVEEMRRAIAKASGSNPPMAEKNLTNLQDFHTSLGDNIRRRAADMQNMIESTPFKYDVGHYVFTEDSARKNFPPMKILSRVMVGDNPIREGGIGSKVVKDPVTGKTMRTPHEPGYRVRLEHSPENWSEFRIPESAIKGRVEMARGGRVTHAHHLDIEERPL
jgi:hypothetical protein